MPHTPHIEPLPENYFVPGDVVYDCALRYYKITSYPFCRLYYDPNAKFQFQPHSFEALRPEDRRKGIKVNHLSYMATMLDGSFEFVVTAINFKKAS